MNTFTFPHTQSIDHTKIRFTCLYFVIIFISEINCVLQIKLKLVFQSIGCDPKIHQMKNKHAPAIDLAVKNMFPKPTRKIWK